MPIRYTDLDLDLSGARDFVIRQRTPTALQLTLIFLSILFVVITMVHTVFNPLVLSVILFASIGMAGWYVIIQIQRSRDLLLATEFQNSLFASALGLNHKFCLIIRNNGSIVHMDRAFQSMFPDFAKLSMRSIDTLLGYGKVSPEDSEKIYSAIEHGTFERVIFQIHGAKGEVFKIIMSIEPILRPSGFVLLRGREFVETRTAAAAADGSAPDSAGKPTIALFSHVVDSLNIGVYMSNPSGNIIYSNRVLEQWLGYNDGEIVSKNLSLRDVVHQVEGNPEDDKAFDFEGNVMLQKKTGGLVKTFFNQKRLYNNDQKLVGCTAIVHLLSENTPDGKKKLW